jgi:hypothetical protein
LALGLLSKGGRKSKTIIMDEGKETETIFSSIKDAVTSLGLKESDYHNIASCCNGRKKMFNNANWKYK